MQLHIWIATISNRHGDSVKAATTEADATKIVADYVRQKRPADLARMDDAAAIRAFYGRPFADEPGLGGEDEGYEVEPHEIAMAPPADAVDAARAGVAALRYARDCFYVAGADRTVARVKDAISSALGAVRNAENKAVRL